MSTCTPAPRRRRLRSEDGFTLVELVVSVAILGFVTVALTGIVLSYLRNTVDTQARLTESQDVQLAAAYWQRDVASIGVRSAAYDSTPAVHSFALEQSVGLSPCGSLPPDATAVVTLGWSEYTSPVSTAEPDLVKVTYATRPDGGGLDLLRVRCGSVPATLQVADHLSVAPTVTCRDAAGTPTGCTGAGSDVPARVDLSLSVHDGSGRDLPTYQATLTGERRQT